MKNKKGFTLIELLATIAILGIIATVAGISVSKILSKSKTDTNDIQIDLIEGAAHSYVAKNLSKCNSFCTFTIDDLVNGGYIDELEDITGYINVVKDNKNYNYDINITSGDKTISNGIVMENGSTYDYTGNVQTYKTSKDSKCLLEVWGAEGGSTSSYSGGKGGYSKGIIKLEKDTTLYIYVGGAGKSDVATIEISGGYNGGGSCGIKPNNNSYKRGSGGGATDIRIDTDNDGTQTLYERIIVAGGGGGAGYAYSSSYVTEPGAGGGTNGISAKDSTDGTRTGGKGGTQSEGGIAGKYGASSYGGTAGTFGIGGTAGYTSSNFFTGGAGGGGWYGGGGSGDGGPSGGGGSGYILTSSSHKPDGYNPPSKYYLTSAITIDGTKDFISPNGTTEKGHSGNGYARITCN